MGNKKRRYEDSGVNKIIEKEWFTLKQLF